MLTTGSYTFEELAEILGSTSNTNLRQKLNRYDIRFSNTGRGKDARYHIHQIINPFKLYCILELNFPAQCDFQKLRNFCHYFFCDDEFPALPMEEMEKRLKETDYSPSRQTISKWITRFACLDWVSRGSEFVYYKVNKTNEAQTHILITKEEYKSAWKEYWRCREEGYDSAAAYFTMYKKFGGVPRKQAIIEKNGIYMNDINLLIELATESILNEMEQNA